MLEINYTLLDKSKTLTVTDRETINALRNEAAASGSSIGGVLAVGQVIESVNVKINWMRDLCDFCEVLEVDEPGTTCKSCCDKVAGNIDRVEHQNGCDW